MMRAHTLVPVRGFRAPDAARYVGMSESKFLAMVSDGRMPRGFEIDRMRIWDVHDLDVAFDMLKAGQNAFTAPKPVDEGWDGVAP